MDALSINIFFKFWYPSKCKLSIYILEYPFISAILSQQEFTGKVLERNIKIKHESYFLQKKRKHHLLGNQVSQGLLNDLEPLLYLLCS